MFYLDEWVYDTTMWYTNTDTVIAMLLRPPRHKQTPWWHHSAVRSLANTDTDTDTDIVLVQDSILYYSTV